MVGGAGLKVSPGGYMAGGGLGPLSHGLGLGVDSVLEIKVGPTNHPRSLPVKIHISNMKQ